MGQDRSDAAVATTAARAVLEKLKAPEKKVATINRNAESNFHKQDAEKAKAILLGIRLMLSSRSY